MSTWITPKTDWTATTPITPTDYNRIRNNLLYINEVLNTRYPSRAETLDLGGEKTLGDRIYPSEINAFEEALVSFTRISDTENVGERGYWYDNAPFIGFVDLNRIEMCCLRWYEEPASDPTEVMPFKMGACGTAINLTDGIHLLGGYGDTMAHVVYHPETETYERLPDAPATTARRPAWGTEMRIYLWSYNSEEKSTTLHKWNNGTWSAYNKVKNFNPLDGFAYFKSDVVHYYVNSTGKTKLFASDNEVTVAKRKVPADYTYGKSFNTCYQYYGTNHVNDSVFYIDKNKKICRMIIDEPAKFVYKEFEIKAPSEGGVFADTTVNGERRVFYFGGKGKPYIYELEFKSAIVPNMFKKIGDLPYEMINASAVARTVNGENCIFVFGGEGENNDGDRVFKYIPS